MNRAIGDDAGMAVRRGDPIRSDAARDRLSLPARFNDGMALLHLEPLPPRTSKGDLLALLQTQGGLRRDRVGKIDLRGNTAAVEVPDDWVARLVRSLDGAALKDRKLRAWSLATRPS